MTFRNLSIAALAALFFLGTMHGSFSTSAAAPSAEEFIGLWKATRRFGPDERGPLVILKNANGWTADFIGRSYAIADDHGRLTFALADGKGDFAGHLQTDGSITGHWTLSKAGLSVPIVLKADGKTAGAARSCPMTTILRSTC